MDRQIPRDATTPHALVIPEGFGRWYTQACKREIVNMKICNVIHYVNEMRREVIQDVRGASGRGV